MNQSVGPKNDVALLVAMLRFASLVNLPMRAGVADANGLSLNNLRIMIALSGEGAKAGYELAELMGMQPMSVSRALAYLTEIGWIEEVPNSENRRRRPYQLSDLGWRAYDNMGPTLERTAHYLLEPLTATERRNLASSMAKLADRSLGWTDQITQSDSHSD